MGELCHAHGRSYRQWRHEGGSELGPVLDMFGSWLTVSVRPPKSIGSRRAAEGAPFDRDRCSRGRLFVAIAKRDAASWDDCARFRSAGIAVVRIGRDWLASPRIAAVFAVLAIVGAAIHLRGVGSVLNQARKHAVSGLAGREACLAQSLSGAPVPAERIAFVRWVKRRLPASAVYSLGSYEGEPDIWCITQVLLPSLPAGPGARATWTITMGTSPVPPAERGTRPDREVLIYRPGYAIVRSGG